MSLSLLPAMFGGLAVAAVLMLAMWLASLARHDASLVDRVWGLGFVLLGWFYLAVAGHFHNALAALLVSLWGLRLSLHLTRRNWGRGEDRRYAKMRDKHGPRFAWFSLFSVFLLQAILMWVIAFPLLAASRGAHPGWGGAVLTMAGMFVWLAGFVFEAVGDNQLARFKRDPANAGRVLDTGLWRYTRHPNYFGDMLVWWGLYLVAVASGGWWTIFSPLLMSLFLARVSGVTLLERHLQESRPGYSDYARRTSALIPLPPRRPERD